MFVLPFFKEEGKSRLMTFVFETQGYCYIAVVRILSALHLRICDLIEALKFGVNNTPEMFKQPFFGKYLREKENKKDILPFSLNYTKVMPIYFIFHSREGI